MNSILDAKEPIMIPSLSITILPLQERVNLVIWAVFETEYQWQASPRVSPFSYRHPDILSSTERGSFLAD